MSRLIKNRAREVMERNWIIIQTGEGKMRVGGSKSPKRNVPYSDAFLSFVVRGTKTFLCVFVLFLAKNDGSCAKDVCFL